MNALQSIVATTLVSVIALLPSPGPGNEHRQVHAAMGCEQLAQGILVQPDAGALEPPSIGSEKDDDGADESGEDVPAVLEQRGVEVIPAPIPVPESPEQELERPGARQDELERGGARQRELETPEGPGIRY